MSWGGLDQRVFPRYSAKCDVTIMGDGETIKAVTHNIGTGGVCIMMPKELAKLSHVKLRLALNDLTPSIECTARVVWMITSKELSARKPTYDTGLEFVDLKPEDLEKIQTFVNQLNRQHGIR